jgi:hypothetical protein
LDIVNAGLNHRKPVVYSSPLLHWCAERRGGGRTIQTFVSLVVRFCYDSLSHPAFDQHCCLGQTRLPKITILRASLPQNRDFTQNPRKHDPSLLKICRALHGPHQTNAQTTLFAPSSGQSISGASQFFPSDSDRELTPRIRSFRTGERSLCPILCPLLTDTVPHRAILPIRGQGGQRPDVQAVARDSTGDLVALPGIEPGFED